MPLLRQTKRMCSHPVLSICGASAAEGVVRARLEQFSQLQISSLASDDVPVSETWEEGLGTAGILVLLHPDAMPPKPSRQYWGSMIDYAGPQPIAFVHCGAREYPAVFERRTFFRWPTDQRAIERWVVKLMPRPAGTNVAPATGVVSEDLWTTLVDRPGVFFLTGGPATGKSRMAQAFAHAARGHFQSMLWIGCGGRSTEALANEIVRRLPSGRTLLVLDDLREPMALPGAPHSVLVTSREPLGEGEWLDLEDRYPLPALAGTAMEQAIAVCFAPDFPLSLVREIAGDPAALPGDAAELLEAGRDRYRAIVAPPPTKAVAARHCYAVLQRFRHWRAQTERCAEVEYELEAALAFAFTCQWEDAIDLCRAASDYFGEAGRQPDGVAILQRLLAEAEGRGDRVTIAIAKEKLSWVIDAEGEPLPVTHPGDQLFLF